MRLYSAVLVAMMLVGCDKPPTLEQGMSLYTQSQFGPAASALQPYADCSGLMKPDTHLGENARHREVSDDQTTPYLFP